MSSIASDVNSTSSFAQSQWLQALAPAPPAPQAELPTVRGIAGCDERAGHIHRTGKSTTHRQSCTGEPRAYQSRAGKFGVVEPGAGELRADEPGICESSADEFLSRKPRVDQ